MSTLGWTLAALILLALFLYSIQLFRWRKGMMKLFDRKEEIQKQAREEEGLSIVVPVRNERGRWEQLLEDLQDQVLGREGRELLFVDDHSEDGSGERLMDHCQGKEGLRALALPDGEKGKKRALLKGIGEAKWENVLTLDADVRVPEDLLDRLEGAIAQKRADLYLLPVLPFPPRGFLQHALYFEALALLGVLIGSAGVGRPALANGAGMVLRKTPFLKEGGYDDHLHIDSGDDIFLLQRWVQKGRKVEVLPFCDLTVRTRYPSGFREWMDQRLRWASKARAFRDRRILLALSLVGGANWLLALSPLLLVLDPQYLSVWLISWGLKGGVDRIFLTLPLQRLGKSFSWKHFPLAFLLYPFQVTLIPVVAFFHEPLWKGRRIADR